MSYLSRLAERSLAIWLDRLSPGKQLWAVSRLAAVFGATLEPPLLAHLVRILGRRLGISSFGVEGLLGRFEGSIDDAAVLDWYLLHGEWETWLQTLLIDDIFYCGQGCLVDVGANIGLTCVPVVRARSINCHAFEPEPANYGYLRRNARANGVDDKLTCHQVACFSNDAESLAFELSSTNKGDHRASPPGSSALSNNPQGGTVHSIAVPCRRLDTVLSAHDLDRPLAVKIDTQGCEVKVIKGGMKLLASADFLVSEVNPALLRRMGDSPDALVELLTHLGFAYGAAYVPEGATPLGPRLPFASFVETFRDLSRRCWSRGEFNVVLAREPDSPASIDRVRYEPPPAPCEH